MIFLIARRIVLALVTLLFISIIIFLGVEALPGDAATAYLGQSATPESLKALREEFGLNPPTHQRYLNWLGDILKGDLGDSMARRKPVSEIIGNQFRNTVVLAAAAALVGVPLAIVLGVFTGLTRDKWPDILVSLVAIIGMTLPGFVTATWLPQMPPSSKYSPTSFCQSSPSHLSWLPIFCDWCVPT
jgi:peptide/nickel transport system permease protein